MNNKLIREIRFGMPKQWKTGAVVSTYPRPLLALVFEEGGLDVVQEPIVYIKPSELAEMLTRSVDKIPPIVAIDFCDESKQVLTGMYAATGNREGFESVIMVINLLVQAKTMPFKTIVLDSITQMSEVILRHIAATQAAAMADARKWAGNIGLKIAQIMGVLNSVNAHVVYIMHAEMQQNEQTNEISVLPLVHSKLRNKIGALVSQFLYACKEGGKPVVYTTDKGFIKGIGCRWPANLPPVCGATFKDIYGKELL